MSLHLAAYDISHGSNRRRVAKILLRYGRRVQESVFEIDLDRFDLDELKRLVGPLLEATDEFDIFPIDSRRPASRVRWQEEPYGEPVRMI